MSVLLDIVVFLSVWSYLFLFRETNSLLYPNWKGNSTLILRVGVGARKGVDVQWFFKKMSIPSICVCKNACYTHLQCSSFLYNEKTLICRLFERNFEEEVLDEMPKHIYGHRTVTGKADSTLHLGPDGMYYYYSRLVYLYQDAVTFCNEPGFHLPVIITRKQYNAVKHLKDETQASIYLGLIRYSNQSLLWPNGMDYNEFTLGNINMEAIIYFNGANTKDAYFQLPDYRVHDIATLADFRAAVVCQANLDKIPWQT